MRTNVSDLEAHRHDRETGVTTRKQGRAHLARLRAQLRGEPSSYEPVDVEQLDLELLGRPVVHVREYPRSSADRSEQ